MDNNQKEIMLKRIDKTIKALQKNRMEAHYAETAEQAYKLIMSLIPQGATVSMGGTVTARQLGVTDALKSGKYNFLDRTLAKTPQEIDDIYRKTFFADYFVTSSNAVTENGELYNVDGNANRVAAMLYGPKNVIVAVGYNKIVKNIDEAVLRVKSEAAPANCIRLNLDTYCAQNGECVSLKASNPYICMGCAPDKRICRNYTIMSSQRIENRIKVVIVGEQLGY